LKFIKEHTSITSTKGKSITDEKPWEIILHLIMFSFGSMFVGAFAALISIVVIAPSLFLFNAIYSDSFFSGIRFTGDNTLQYSIYAGIIGGIVFFLKAGVMPFLNRDELEENKNNYYKIKAS
jgi:hypothetical protein